jgi:hypothetical protein
VKTVAERLQIFYGKLAASPPAASSEEALAQINETLNAVEDEFSGLPYDPPSWRIHPRMYGPQPDSEREVPGWPNVRRLRLRKHSAFIGLNGSIEIRFDKPSPRAGQVEFSKEGSDGKGVWEQNESDPDHTDETPSSSADG